MRSATSFPLPLVAIWRKAGAYLAAFGGRAPEAGFEPRMIERDLPAPGAREVRLRVAACGVPQRLRHRPAPRAGHHLSAVPGHEVIGMVEAIGPDVSAGTWACGRLVQRCVRVLRPLPRR